MEVKILDAKQREQLSDRLQSHKQQKLVYEQLFKNTPLRQTKRRNEIQLNINKLQLAISELKSQIELQRVTNPSTLEELELRLKQVKNRQIREKFLFDNRQTQIHAELELLNKELGQNRQNQQNQLNILQQQQQQSSSSTPNIRKNYTGCVDGESGPPNAQQKLLARTIRDNMTYQLIRFTDSQYYQFENDLYVGRSTGSILADIIDTGANFAGTITNGERAKTIINAAVIGFRNGRKSVSLNYFREQTGEILITKMQTARNRVLQEILAQINEKDVDQYPLDAALGDVIRYFYAGSLPRALQELQQDTSIAAREARNGVLRIKKVPEAQIVQPIPKNVSEAISVIGGYFNDYKPIFKGSDSELKAKATEELRKIYTEITTGNKKDEFKPILEELKKTERFKKWMEKLDSNDPSQINQVEGINLFELVSETFFFARTEKKDDAVIALKETLVKVKS